jgi:uncharacterized protein (TIGR02246 family)
MKRIRPGTIAVRDPAQPGGKIMAARKPEEVDQMFAQAFSAGDLEALVALYEPGAALVLESGKTVTGRDAIRETLQGFLTLCSNFRIEVISMVPAGDVALVRSDWSLTGTGPGGYQVELSGHGVEVVRRQPDGAWLYAIDNPFGCE